MLITKKLPGKYIYFPLIQKLHVLSSCQSLIICRWAVLGHSSYPAILIITGASSHVSPSILRSMIPKQKIEFTLAVTTRRDIESKSNGDITELILTEPKQS